MAHDVTRKWHKRLHESLVSIPAMAPGDTVWWHSDVIHAVERSHVGSEDSSVFYVPSFPATLRNAEYVARQRQHFVQGRTPPDFPPNDSEATFSGRATEQHLTGLGRRLIGLEPFAALVAGSEASGADGGVAASSLLEESNAILGF